MDRITGLQPGETGFFVADPPRVGHAGPAPAPLTGATSFEDESLFFLLSLRESLSEKGYSAGSRQVRRVAGLLELARGEGLL